MLRSTFVTTGLLLVGVGLFASGQSSHAAGVDRLAHGRQVVLEFTGSGNGVEVGGAGSGVLSFAGVFSNPITGEIVGTGADALDLNSIEGGNPFAGENFVMSNTTTFNLPGGTLTTQNRTSLATFTQGTLGPLEQQVTHLTSDFSRGKIVSGTGRYEGLTGEVRLSGAVDMSQFTGGPGSPISFNCLFLIDLD